MKRAILTIAIIFVLLLAGLFAVTSIKTVTVKNISASAQVTEEIVEVAKLTENGHLRHWFFFADVNSTGYAETAVIRCYDGIISVTYSDGITVIDAPIRYKTFTGAHTIKIYGFGGTKNWGGSVTGRNISFTGLGIICFIQPL